MVGDKGEWLWSLHKEVKLLSRAQGVPMHVVYIVIWLIRAESRDQWLEDTRKLIDLVQSWVERSISKSELEPAQTLDILGYHVDLIQGLVFPIAEKLGQCAQIAVF